jgi:hypothetical protein
MGMKKNASVITVDFLLLVILVAIATQSIPPISDYLIATRDEYAQAVSAAAQGRPEEVPEELVPFVSNYFIFLKAPIKWALVSVCFIIIFAYLCVNLLKAFEKIGEKTAFCLKFILIVPLVMITAFLPVLFRMTVDRHAQGGTPLSLSRKAQATQNGAKMVLLQGKNPYEGTITIEIPNPQAEAGTEESTTINQEKFSTAITSLASSLPVYVIIEGLCNYYDQRMTYLLYAALMMVVIMTLNAPHGSRLVLVIFVLLFSPFRVGFYSGSDALVPVFWLIVCLHGLLRKNHVLASISISLAALAQPLLYIVVLLYFAYLLSVRKSESVRAFGHTLFVLFIVAFFGLCFMSAGVRPLLAPLETMFFETSPMRPGSYGISNLLVWAGLAQSPETGLPFWAIAAVTAFIVFIPLVVRQKRKRTAVVFFENTFIMLFLLGFLALPSFNNDALYLVSAALAIVAVCHWERKDAEPESELPGGP